MARKDWIRRLEKAARGQLESFELDDGTRYYYDRQQANVDVFVHATACASHHGEPEWPEPPEVLRMMVRARDREAVLRDFLYEGRMLFPYEIDALIDRGEFVRRSLIDGYEPGDGRDVPDMSMASEGFAGDEED